MKTLDLKKMKLPLSSKKFKNLRKAIRSGHIKWMDMSNELMYAYQDYWRFKRLKKAENSV